MRLQKPMPAGFKTLLCIDPGSVFSGVVVLEEEGNVVIASNAEMPNVYLLRTIEGFSGSEKPDILLIEHVESFGMAVGRSVFETVRWSGIFQHAFGIDDTILLPRRDVKIALCGTSASKESNVRQAILDRYPPTGGGATPQIGTKKKPGPLYGMKSHAFSALALGLTWRDTYHTEKPWKRLIPKTSAPKRSKKAPKVEMLLTTP